MNECEREDLCKLNSEKGLNLDEALAPQKSRLEYLLGFVGLHLEEEAVVSNSCSTMKMTKQRKN